MERGFRGARDGIPKDKLIQDIGHDLKNSVKFEIKKIKEAVKVQHRDFQDQVVKMESEA